MATWRCKESRHQSDFSPLCKKQEIVGNRLVLLTFLNGQTNPVINFSQWDINPYYLLYSIGNQFLLLP
jgi:hypothetical protein